MKKQNKVWLEFETQPPTPEAVDLMNKMLDRLNVSRYFMIGDDGDLLLVDKVSSTFHACLDNGSWFSLDYFGKDKD
jgi:hypothetical protein